MKSEGCCYPDCFHCPLPDCEVDDNMIPKYADSKARYRIDHREQTRKANRRYYQRNKKKILQKQKERRQRIREERKSKEESI